MFNRSLSNIAIVTFLLCYSAVAENNQETNSDDLVEIVVDSVPLNQTLIESAQPVTILEGKELTSKIRSSLGETLSSEIGISSSSFGPAAGRPVIRGLGGDRIRVLENGVATQDVSNISPDHAATVDLLNAEKIEVIRGPATLLYGTNAVGGIVNIFDSKIAKYLPDNDFQGQATIQGGTNSLERSGALSFDAVFDKFVFHFDSTAQKADNIQIPGFARTSELRESGPELEFPEPRGEVPYSQSEYTNFAAGGSYIFGDGFIGLSASMYNNDYGVPNGEKNITIDGRRPKFDLHGRVEDPIDFLEYLDLKIGYADYKHTEFEDGEAGTVFKNRGYDGRLEMAHLPIGDLEGIFGIQGQHNDFSAIGEESFQPPSETAILSAFLFEKLKLNQRLHLEAGIRVDNSEIDVTGYVAPNSEISSDTGESFTTFGNSLGAVWSADNSHAVALSLSYTERAPSAQELYANGPHVATAAYEIGDPSLDKEKSLGVDLSLRRTNGRITGQVGGFYSRYSDYIGLNSTGEIQDDFQVYKFEAQDVDFYGIESKFIYHFYSDKAEDNALKDLSFFIQPDYVWAEDRDTSNPLPRIPPLRIKSGISFNDSDYNAYFNVFHVCKQGRNAEFETETPSYTTLNLGVSKNIKIEDYNYEFYLRADNLTNEKARNHLSFIKDITPLPGVNVTAGVRVVF